MSRGKRAASRDDEATFQQMVSELKPLARQLKDREEKQRVVLWLRKLHEPVGASPVKKENRLMYTRLLLHMLKRGVLEGPFNQSPERGELKTLPSYMSIYFDDPREDRQVDEFSLNLSDDDFDLDLEPETQQGVSKLTTNAKKNSSHLRMSRAISPILSETNDQDSLLDTESQLPLESLNDETSELDIDLDIDLDLELQKLADEQRHITRSRNRTASRQVANEMNATSGLREKGILTREEHEDDVDRLLMQRKGPLSLSQTRQPRSSLHSPVQFGSPPMLNTSLSRSYGDAALQSFREERNRIRLQQKEVDLKLKMAHSQFQEEKMQLQAQHDRQLKEMLDHKNTEIEIVKAECRQKVQDAELTIDALERKVNQLEREGQYVREHKDKQLNELKTRVQQKIQDLTRDLDARLEEAAAESERQKLALKQQNTRQMQELVEQTSERLRRMETEYNAQSQNKDEVIKELEGQVKRLRQDIEQAVSTANRVARDKSDLERMQETVQSQLENSKRIIGELESDRLRLEQEQECQLQDVRSQSQSLQEELKHEHTLAAARAADQISELGQTVNELKKALKLKEQERQKSVKSLEVDHQRDKQRLEHAYEKKIRSMLAELEQQEAENKQKLQKLSILVRERDDQLLEMRVAQREQAQRAEHALDEFKQQAEKNSTRVFDDMKTQMERVETDLERSKVAREKIIRDATHQIEEIRTKHSREVSDVKLHYEQEKAVLVQQHRAELESIVRERDRERDTALKHMQSVLAEQETKMRSKEQRDAQRIAECEQEVQKLSDELLQERSHHESDMARLEMHYKEQQQLATRSRDASLTKCRSDLEQHHLQLQQEHSAEMERVIQKTSGRLNEMEKEYTVKINKANETIGQLQAYVQQLRAEKQRLKEEWQDQLATSTTRHEAEILSLKTQNHSTVQSLEQELMANKNLIRQLEKKVRQLQVEGNEKLSTLQLQYEEKLKGLMPESIREQLEGTITSLKSQTRLLEQRNKLLQDELDCRPSHTSLIPSLSHSMTSTPSRPPVS